MYYFDLKDEIIPVFQKALETKNYKYLVKSIMALPMPHQLVGITELTTCLQGFPTSDSDNLKAAIAFILEDAQQLEIENRYQVWNAAKEEYFHLVYDDDGFVDAISVPMEEIKKFLAIRFEYAQSKLN